MDILSTTNGKVDNPGRVRGESKTVGLSQYFGRASKTGPQISPQNLSQVEARIEAKFEALLQVRLQEQMNKFQDEMKSFFSTSLGSGQTQEKETADKVFNFLNCVTISSAISFID